MYFLGARLFGRTAGAISAAAFAVLSLAPEAFGLHAHATHFISPFVVGALILLVKDFTPLRLFGAGALLGAGVLMKQPAMFFAAFAVVYVFIVSTRRPRDLGMVAAGGAAVAAIAASALAATGVFGRFWFWTISYAREYVTSIPFGEGLGYLGRNLGGIIGFAPAIWLVAAAGVVFLLQRGASRERVFVFGFLIAGLLATTPGFYFRHHYFIVVFPAIALLAGAAVALAPRTLPRHAPALAAVVALVLTIVLGWPRLMGTSEDRSSSSSSARARRGCASRVPTCASSTGSAASRRRGGGSSTASSTSPNRGASTCGARPRRHTGRAARTSCCSTGTPASRRLAGRRPGAPRAAARRRRSSRRDGGGPTSRRPPSTAGTRCTPRSSCPCTACARRWSASRCSPADRSRRRAAPR